MAQFRRSHGRNSSGQGMQKMLRTVLFSLILILIYAGVRQFTGSGTSEEHEQQEVPDVGNLTQGGADSIYFLPARGAGTLVRHKYYALSYVEQYEQPEWVAYELTSSRLPRRGVQRRDDFRPDPLVPGGSASLEDYRDSYWDRGHLVPAADMAFSREAMSETFLLSNISPQDPAFNKGIWRELEELTRDWARVSRHLYVVTGPVLTPTAKTWIGENQVAVPRAYYRVLLDLREPEQKAIAFLIPNELSDERLETYSLSVDEVEKITGLDFFPELLEDTLEDTLESSYNHSLWKTNEKKYRLRIEKWNKQQ